MKLTGIIENVFNGRLIFRGYATLVDLVEFSQSNDNYQRKADSTRIKQIATFMNGDNVGWRLENVVYIELLRRCTNDFLDIYYYKASPRSKEVDFVVCNQDKTVELIQVAYDIENEKTYNRETSSLVKASTSLRCENLTLIAFTKTRVVEIEGKRIKILHAIDWLLNR